MTMNIRSTISVLLGVTLGLSLQVAQAGTACSAENIGAEYSRWAEPVDSKHKHDHDQGNSVQHRKVGQQTLKLWRIGSEVLHEFPQLQVANRWSMVKDGRLKLTRYFDPYQRAIEYQPGELNRGEGFWDWEVRYQLISSALLTALKPGVITGKGCEQVQRYEGTVGGEQVTLEWMPKLNLLKRFERRTAKEVQTTELVRLIKDTHAVDHSRDDFKQFDFADIGDNETDPFLSKLINIGFIEHAASGIYDAQGRPLQGPDTHGHHQH